ncbi:nicotinate-nucleotide adenylyltransferase [Paraglaciecola sp. 2405UD69-4]|uniref:nicotinate-nucleotide adenylyltransferase n=1 Tax=Paraglaciecola sp. 2405UD69-4 TaxID=3391836 RepID=UPI0039C9D3CD
MSGSKRLIEAPLGIFGGTFDPIHNGHIFPILEAAEIAKIDKIALTPCYVPTHKSAATASSEHRLNMAKILCEEYPIFYPEPLDINRNKPTYSIDTLSELNAKFPNTPLCFFIGTDSLVNIFEWHNWERLFELCHFIVCQRESDDIKQVLNSKTHNEQLQILLQQRQVNDPLSLHQSLAGNIFVANTTPLTISSSTIRKMLTNGNSVEKWLPSSINQYIQQHKLYQQAGKIC